MSIYKHKNIAVLGNKLKGTWKNSALVLIRKYLWITLEVPLPVFLFGHVHEVSSLSTLFSISAHTVYASVFAVQQDGKNPRSLSETKESNPEAL